MIQPEVVNENGRLNQQQPDSRARVLIGFSVINILTWLLSTTFSAMLLIRFNNATSLVRFQSLDLICPGIWGSLFYGLTGLIGICAAYEKRQPLLVGTLVLSMLSVFSSLGIATVHGAMAISPKFRSGTNETWLGLEWTLFVTSLIGGLLINLAVFILVSTLMCRPCCPSINSSNNKPMEETVVLNDYNSNHLPCCPTLSRMPAEPPAPPPGFFFRQPMEHLYDRPPARTPLILPFPSINITESNN